MSAARSQQPVELVRASRSRDAKQVAWLCGGDHVVPLDRAGHAARAAAAAPQLGAGDGDYLDPLAAEPGVRVDVALVGDDDAGRDGEHVVAVVPLLALGLVLVAAGLEQPEPRHVERAGDRRRRGRPRAPRRVPSVRRRDAEADQLVADLRVDREGVTVDLRHDRVEVHARPLRGHRHRDDALRRARIEQPPCQQLDAGRAACARPCRSGRSRSRSRGRRRPRAAPGRPRRSLQVSCGSAGEQRVVAVDRRRGEPPRAAAPAWPSRGR